MAREQPGLGSVDPVLPTALGLWPGSPAEASLASRLRGTGAQSLPGWGRASFPSHQQTNGSQQGPHADTWCFVRCRWGGQVCRALRACRQPRVTQTVRSLLDTCAGSGGHADRERTCSAQPCPPLRSHGVGPRALEQWAGPSLLGPRGLECDDLGILDVISGTTGAMRRLTCSVEGIWGLLACRGQWEERPRVPEP